MCNMYVDTYPYIMFLSFSSMSLWFKFLFVVPTYLTGLMWNIKFIFHIIFILSIFLITAFWFIVNKSKVLNVSYIYSKLREYSNRYIPIILSILSTAQLIFSLIFIFVFCTIPIFDILIAVSDLITVTGNITGLYLSQSKDNLELHTTENEYLLKPLHKDDTFVSNV